MSFAVWFGFYAGGKMTERPQNKRKNSIGCHSEMHQKKSKIFL